MAERFSESEKPFVINQLRILGHVNRDSGDVNNPNRDERGGVEPGLILTFLDQAF
jgi:hypothetical protein